MTTRDISALFNILPDFDPVLEGVNEILLLLPDFNQDGRPDNISFMIKRVKVHSEDALRDPNYRFPGNYGVEKYLELFSGK